MFKRAGRVLFLDLGDGTRARVAQAWANELGGRWVEPGAAAMVPGVPGPALARAMAEVDVAVDSRPCPFWEEAVEAGWDLVVALDWQGRDEWPARLRGLRIKTWNLAEACALTGHGLGLAEIRPCREELRNRVEGLLGGFRMKAREDDSEEGMVDDRCSG